MHELRSKHPWLVALRGAAIVAALAGVGFMSPAAVPVAEAQEDTAAARLENRIPSSDPASDYVNDRLAAAEAAAEAAAAAETSTEAPAEASGEPAPEATADPPPEESAESVGGETADSKGGAGEPTAEDAAPESGDGTTATLSGSDVVVSSVGESNQVDKPGRRGKGRR